MSLAPRAVVGFTVVVATVLAGVMVMPSPYADGIPVARSTGAPAPGPAHALAAIRQAGELGALVSGLPAIATPEAPVVRGLAAMVAAELSPPDFAADSSQPAAVEGFFRGVESPAGLDARAAGMQQRLLAGERPPVAELLGLAAGFRAQGRQRAELRWLERAVQLQADSVPAADRLLAFYLAHGRLDAALALVQARAADRADDLAWQREAARLGAWLGRADVEIDALERVCAVAPEPADRSRLVELWSHVGQPERALPHAIALVDGAAEVAAAEAGASSVLRAGFVDEGLAMLQRAASRAIAAAPWWQRFALLARQDLRVDDTAKALTRAAELDPLAAEQQLEEFYRRTDRPDRLADLLQQRLARTPTDAKLWREVLTLRHALGQHEAAEALAMQRDVALADPERFVAELPAAERSPASSLREQALSLSLGPDAESGVVGETLERLRPFLAQPGFRALAESLLVRYPNDPRAKPMRRELVDIGRGPLEAERAAAALSSTYPDDVELARLWLQRGQWAENAKAQIAARSRILALQPEDRHNRHELADLLEYTGQPREAIAHWRLLIADEGIAAPAVPRLIAALHTIGESDEAVEWLRRLAADARASREQRLLAADELFDRRRHDEAKVLYEAVLAVHPDDPRALLRLGLLAAWRGDARTARPYFERRLAASGDDRALVRFQLGEALWNLGETTRARAMHAESLRELAQVAAPDAETRTAIAVMLDRADRGPEAIAAYRDLVARSPRDVDLVLDYADVVMRRGDLAVAGAALAQAEALAPTSLRATRLRAEIARRSGDTVAAERALTQALELGGADADILGDLASLQFENGAWASARIAAERRLAAEPDDLGALRAEWQLRELLADFADGRLRYRRIGRERHVEAAAGGVVMFDERHWLQGEVAALDLRGTTSLAASGELSTDFTRVEAAFGVRSGARDRFAFGVEAAPGANGDTPLGVHAALHWEWPEQAVLQLQGRWHEVWTEPAAAAALGGRRSGIEAISYFELGHGSWATADLGVGHFSLDDDLAAGRDDTRLHADVTAGYRWLDGERAVASWFSPNMVPAGPDSPFLAASPDVDQGWNGELSLSWRTARVLGDSELAGVLPFSDRDDQLTGAVRVDRHVARQFGAAVTAYAGVDLRDGEPIFGAAAAVTWRPSFGTEFTLEGGRGATFGRGDDDEVEELRLQVVLRW